MTDVLLKNFLRIFGIIMQDDFFHNNEVPKASHPPHGNGVRILLVEDQDDLRKVICKALEAYGYDVIAASDGNQAIALCADAEKEFHLLFSDVVLPGFDGIQLAHNLLSRKPNLKILLTSGFTDQLHIIRERNYPFLQKPYSVEELLNAIRTIIDKAS